MKELVSSPERKQVMEEPTYDHFWKFHNKDNMDVHAVALIEQQAERIKELEGVNKKLKDLLKEEVDDGRAMIDDMGFDAWLEQALKGE